MDCVVVVDVVPRPSEPSVRLRSAGRREHGEGGRGLEGRPPPPRVRGGGHRAAEQVGRHGDGGPNSGGV